MEKFIVQQEFLQDEEDIQFTKQVIEKVEKEVNEDLLERSAVNIFSDIRTYLERVGLYGEICVNLNVNNIINYLKGVRNS